MHAYNSIKWIDDGWNDDRKRENMLQNSKKNNNKAQNITQIELNPFSLKQKIFI